MLSIYINWIVHERCHGHTTSWRRLRTYHWSSMDDAMNHPMDDDSTMGYCMAQSMGQWYVHCAMEHAMVFSSTMAPSTAPYMVYRGRLYGCSHGVRPWICHGYPWYVPRNGGYAWTRPWHRPWTNPWCRSWTMPWRRRWLASMESSMDNVIVASMGDSMVSCHETLHGIVHGVDHGRLHGHPPWRHSWTNPWRRPCTAPWTTPWTAHCTTPWVRP